MAKRYLIIYSTHPVCSWVTESDSSAEAMIRARQDAQDMIQDCEDALNISSEKPGISLATEAAYELGWRKKVQEHVGQKDDPYKAIYIYEKNGGYSRG